MRLSPELTAQVLALAGEAGAKPKRARKSRAVLTAGGPYVPLPEYRPDPESVFGQVPEECVVVRGTHLGEPKSKARPRFTPQVGGRVYTPRETREHEKALLACVIEQLVGVVPNGDWAFGVRAIFYVSSHHRKDTDNMLKSVLDAMNEKVFVDDMQVKEIMSWTVLDTSNPRTEFVVYRMHPIDRSKGHCVVCGKEYRSYKSWAMRRYCSRNCNSIAAGTKVEVSCAECGVKVRRYPKDVTKNQGGKFYCSHLCKSKHNSTALPCARCGASVVRPKSFSKSNQTAFYCGRACYDASRSGRKMNVAPELLSDRSRRGWDTRRANNDST